MTPRQKSSLLWGLVGALAFLVLVQAYRLFGGQLTVGPAAIAAVALLVGATAAGLTGVLEPRLNGRS
jgi:hypothetical protein